MIVASRNKEKMGARWLLGRAKETISERAVAWSISGLHPLSLTLLRIAWTTNRDLEISKTFSLQT